MTDICVYAIWDKKRRQYYAGSGKWSSEPKYYKRIGHAKNAITQYVQNTPWKTGLPVELKDLSLYAFRLDCQDMTDWSDL